MTRPARVRFAPSIRLVLTLFAFVPMFGCSNFDVSKLEAKGFNGTYLDGFGSGLSPIGQIKIRNTHMQSAGGDNKNVLYEFIVNAGALDKYDFQIDGQSINNNFVDAPGGKKRFADTAAASTPVCIDVRLKQAITMAVGEPFSVAFFDPGAALGGSSSTPLKTVDQFMNIFVRGEDDIGNFGVVPGQLVDQMLVDALVDAFKGLSLGVEVPGSSTEQGSRVPEAVIEIFGATWRWTVIEPPKAFPDFPCGAGTYAYTVCPSAGNDLAEPTGVGYTFLVFVVDADIPLADPTNFYTYSFVFDTDGMATNDWVAGPAFPNDFFQGTDRWYEVAYDPSMGWELICSQVTDGASQTVMRGIPTAANAMIVENTITLVVPDSEIHLATKEFANAGVRFTAFRHSGDFGLQPPFDYSADVEPKVDEALFRIE